MKNLFYQISLLLSIVIMAVFSQSCEKIDQEVEGSGFVTTQNHQHQNFTSIEINGVFDVTLTQDSNYMVQVKTDDNLHEYINIFTEADKLIVEMEENVMLHTSKMQLNIALPKLNSLSANGNVSLNTNNEFLLGKLNIDAEGVCDIDFKVNADILHIDLKGVSGLTLEGETNDAKILMEGSGNLKAYKLGINGLTIDKSGIGNAEVLVYDKLIVKINGAGSVYCKGNPGYIEEDINGLGKLVLK